jgi:hypothetical protein
MKNFMLCLICFLPVSLFAQEWKTFNKPDILFTAKYPDSWVNKIKEGKRVFFTSPIEGAADNFAENININVTTKPEFGNTVKIKDIVQEVIQELKKTFNEFKAESEIFMKWNGVEAFEITYTGRPKSDESMEVRIIQRLCFYKTRLYLLTYTALKDSDVYTATAKQIMNSIRFRP